MSRSSNNEEETTRQQQRSKKVRVMGSSGQTDADRRNLRRSQRNLQKSIAVGEMGDAMENPDSDAFEKVREENNRLWDDVRYAREAVLDGENLDLISSRAAKQVDKLIEVPRYDAARLARKLKNKCSSRNSPFDWTMFGREVGTCFNAVPTRVSFLCGPVDNVYTPKERAKRAPRRRAEEEEEVKEEQPEEVKQLEKTADKLSAVEKSMRVVNKTLKNRCTEEAKKQIAHFEGVDESTLNEAEKKRKRKLVKHQQADICAIKYLFNPRSFTQTVENIFHFSFLVKKGDAGIRVDPECGEGPTVRNTHLPETNVIPRQSIVALNMKDWRELIEAYGVEESDIPHRTGSKQTASKPFVKSPSKSQRGDDAASVSTKKRRKRD